MTQRFRDAVRASKQQAELHEMLYGSESRTRLNAAASNLLAIA